MQQLVSASPDLFPARFLLFGSSMFKKVSTNTELGNTELLISSRTSLRNSGLILSADHDGSLLCVISIVKVERTATAVMPESGLSLCLTNTAHQSLCAEGLGRADDPWPIK